MLIANNLSCRLGSQLVVDQFSVQLERGQVLGLLGPNGAGKTTCLRMLSGCLSPDSGYIQINGQDLARAPTAAKTQIGYLPERPPLQTELKLRDYLRFCGQLRGLRGKDLQQAMSESLQACQLEDVAHKRISSLSKGYRQRLGLAQALIHRPALLILDEPTDGLDPNQLQHVRELIRERARESAVLISSHLLAEIEAVCDRVMIMHHGKTVYESALSKRSPNEDILLLKLRLRTPPPIKQLESFPGVLFLKVIKDGTFILHSDANQDPREALLQTAQEQGWGLLELGEEPQHLNQIFAELTK